MAKVLNCHVDRQGRIINSDSNQVILDNFITQDSLSFDGGVATAQSEISSTYTSTTSSNMIVGSFAEYDEINLKLVWKKPANPDTPYYILSVGLGGSGYVNLTTQKVELRSGSSSGTSKLPSFCTADASTDWNICDVTITPTKAVFNWSCGEESWSTNRGYSKINDVRFAVGVYTTDGIAVMVSTDNILPAGFQIKDPYYERSLYLSKFVNGAALKGALQVVRQKLDEIQASSGDVTQEELEAHTGDTTIHVTAEDKAEWHALSTELYGKLSLNPTSNVIITMSNISNQRKYFQIVADKARHELSYEDVIRLLDCTYLTEHKIGDNLTNNISYMNALRDRMNNNLCGYTYDYNTNNLINYSRFFYRSFENSAYVKYLEMRTNSDGTGSISLNSNPTDATSGTGSTQIATTAWVIQLLQDKGLI